MFIQTAVLCLTATSLFARTCADPGKLHSATGNFSVDLHGPVDTRPSTWGTSSVVLKPLTFKAPVGCSVVITHLMGDFIAWPLGDVVKGNQAGVLVSVERTNAPDAWADNPSKLVDFAAPGYFLYVQAGTDGSPARMAFDTNVIEGTLAQDNVLEFKMAEYLNNTDRKVHMEVSFNVTFHFVEPAIDPISVAAL